MTVCKKHRFDNPDLPSASGSVTPVSPPPPLAGAVPSSSSGVAPPSGGPSISVSAAPLSGVVTWRRLIDRFVWAASLAPVEAIGIGNLLKGGLR